MIFGNRNALPAGSRYTIEWFEMEQPVIDGAAHLHIYTRESVLQATRYSPSATPMWHYNAYLKETNDVGLTVDTITMVTHKRDGSMIVDTKSEGKIVDFIGMRYMAPNEYRWFYMSLPADKQTVGMGCVIGGTDSNGNEFCFRLFLPFENAYS